MAFERLKALDNYLAQCKELPNFSDILEQQSIQLVKDIREVPKLELEQAAPLLALVQQNSLWTASLKETICQAIHEKVQESLKGKIVTNRANLQNYVFFPEYLTSGDWDVLMSNQNIGQKCNTVMERCYRLGLRNPTEATYAMVCTCLLLRDQDRFAEPVTLRSSYLTTKQLAKGFLNQKQKANLPSGEVHQYLPPCPRSLEASRWTAAYGEDKPAAKFPDGVTMELLRQLMATVPERGNSALLRVQHQVQGAPAAAFVNPFFMQMAMQMNQMQMGMGSTFFIEEVRSRAQHCHHCQPCQPCHLQTHLHWLCKFNLHPPLRRLQGPR